MPDSWMDAYERNQARTRFAQKSAGSWPSIETTPAATAPKTPGVRALGWELAGYAWGLALNALRGLGNG